MHKLSVCAALAVALAPGSANAQQAIALESSARTAAEPGAAVASEWAERERALGEAMSLSGGVGLLRTQHAQSGAAGQMRLGFTAEYFRASFLCTFEFPCRDRTGRRFAGDTLDHIGGTLAFGITLARIGGSGGLEGYASTTAMANSSNLSQPSLLQVLGDATFGFKLHGRIARTFHAGAFAELMLVNGTGAVGVDGSATSGRFGPVFTFDFRELQARTPLRLSLNVAYSLDNRGKVVEATEAARGTSVTRIERFGLGVNRVDHLDARVGTEVFLGHDRVRPFLEYGIDLPINRQKYQCRLRNPSGDGCLANQALPNSRLTVGARVFPWKAGFSLTAALDVGLTGTKAFLEETLPTPPWTLFFGAGWAIETRDRPPTVITRDRSVEAPRQPQARVRGLVHEKDAPTPVAGAIVTYETQPELTAMATGADGRFATQELGEGTHRFVARAEGYRDAPCEATIARAPDGRAPEDVATDCALEALPRTGTVSGKVRDADGGGPVANAKVRLTGPDGKELSLVTDPSGGFRFEGVSSGAVMIGVDADKYLASVQPADVKPRQDNALDVALRKRPKNALVTVGKTEITIKQQVQFETDSSTILPASFGLMAEVADAFLSNPRVKKVEIQGHTDNTGTPEGNRTLSDARASSVRAWLVAHGVAADRLVAKGYGQDKPVAPNVTPTMRARNRRVQFLILDQDAPTGGQAADAPSRRAPKR